MTSTAAAALPAKVIARKSISGEFAVTGLSASVKRPKVLWIRFVSKVNNGEAIVRRARRFSISSNFPTDMSNFPKIVELRGEWFTSPYPTDTIVEVSSLALPELEIEIEAVAVADEAAERV